MARKRNRKRGRLAAKLGPGSPSAIEAAMRRIGATAIPNGGWIPPGSPYWANLAKVLAAERVGGIGNHDALAERVAVMVPLHASDAWNYVGRALAAHARGDGRVSGHLAYYGELHAAIAILAFGGVGIFDKEMVVVGKTGSGTTRCCIHGTSGTHSMVWDAIRQSPVAADVAEGIFHGISVGGNSLADWLAEFNATGMDGATTLQWLTDWGTDLRDYARDQQMRNQLSYEPSRLANQAVPAGAALGEPLADIWESLEPQEVDRFAALDRELLRAALRTSYKANTEEDARSDAHYRTCVEAAASSLREPVLRSLLDFLAVRDGADAPVVEMAKGGRDADGVHLGMIARAVLLGRLATALSARLLGQAKLRRQDLEFWWEPYGTTAGLWEPGNAPDSFDDLWVEISESVQEWRSWVDRHGNATPPAGPRPWMVMLGNSWKSLGSTEAVAIWGQVA